MSWWESSATIIYVNVYHMPINVMNDNDNENEFIRSK